MARDIHSEVTEPHVMLPDLARFMIGDRVTISGFKDWHSDWQREEMTVIGIHYDTRSRKPNIWVASRHGDVTTDFEPDDLHLVRRYAKDAGPALARLRAQWTDLLSAYSRHLSGDPLTTRTEVLLALAEMVEALTAEFSDGPETARIAA